MGEEMKKFAVILLFVMGLLFLLLFVLLIIFEYYLLKARLYDVPYDIFVSFIQSGILFLIPGISCITVSYLLKRKKIQ